MRSAVSRLGGSGAAICLMIALGVGIVLGVYWAFWMLWCWVLPQLWASGPENVIRPGYWLFVACIFLVSFVGGVIFNNGRSSK